MFLQMNQLSNYLNSHNQAQKGNLIRKGKPAVFFVKWGDKKNTTDASVYMMRHMETYMGQAQTSWSGCILAKSTKQLKVLRARYCVALLSWDSNNVKREVALSAGCYYSELLNIPNFNIEDMLIG